MKNIVKVLLVLFIKSIVANDILPIKIKEFISQDKKVKIKYFEEENHIKAIFTDFDLLMQKKIEWPYDFSSSYIKRICNFYSADLLREAIEYDLKKPIHYQNIVPFNMGDSYDSDMKDFEFEFNFSSYKKEFRKKFINKKIEFINLEKEDITIQIVNYLDDAKIAVFEEYDNLDRKLQFLEGYISRFKKIELDEFGEMHSFVFWPKYLYLHCDLLEDKAFLKISFKKNIKERIYKDIDLLGNRLEIENYAKKIHKEFSKLNLDGLTDEEKSFLAGGVAGKVLLNNSLKLPVELQKKYGPSILGQMYGRMYVDDFGVFKAIDKSSLEEAIEKIFFNAFNEGPLFRYKLIGPPVEISSGDIFIDSKIVSVPSDYVSKF